MKSWPWLSEQVSNTCCCLDALVSVYLFSVSVVNDRTANNVLNTNVAIFFLEAKAIPSTPLQADQRLLHSSWQQVYQLGIHIACFIQLTYFELIWALVGLICLA